MIELQVFSKKHLDKTFLWMQDNKLKDSFLLDKEINREAHQKWFEDIQNDETQKIFAIFYNDVHVGNIGIKNLNLRDKNAESWIYIGNDSYRGKGIAKKSLIALNEKMQKNIVKLYARIADTNIASIKTFIAAGYQIEGILQKELIFKGDFVNIYRLYILL